MTFPGSTYCRRGAVGKASTRSTRNPRRGKPPGSYRLCTLEDVTPKGVCFSFIDAQRCFGRITECTRLFQRTKRLRAFSAIRGRGQERDRDSRRQIDDETVNGAGYGPCGRRAKRAGVYRFSLQGGRGVPANSQLLSGTGSVGPNRTRCGRAGAASMSVRTRRQAVDPGSPCPLAIGGGDDIHSGPCPGIFAA